MSYDIRLCDPVTGDVINLDHPHLMRGGTYAMAGTTELWLNVTYNYSKHYYRSDVFGEKGIRSIYGLTGAESIRSSKEQSVLWAMMLAVIIGYQQKEMPNVHSRSC